MQMWSHLGRHPCFASSTPSLPMVESGAVLLGNFRESVSLFTFTSSSSQTYFHSHQQNAPEPILPHLSFLHWKAKRTLPPNPFIFLNGIKQQKPKASLPLPKPRHLVQLVKKRRGEQQRTGICGLRAGIWWWPGVEFWRQSQESPLRARGAPLCFLLTGHFLPSEVCIIWGPQWTTSGPWNIPCKPSCPSHSQKRKKNLKFPSGKRSRLGVVSHTYNSSTWGCQGRKPTRSQ